MSNSTLIEAGFDQMSRVGEEEPGAGEGRQGGVQARGVCAVLRLGAWKGEAVNVDDRMMRLFLLLKNVGG